MYQNLDSNRNLYRKRGLILLLFSFFMSTGFLFAQKQDGFVQYVNPLVGSLSKYSLSSGNTYPAIARPWGMNFWVPQTGKMGDGWAYVYTADKIRGFKQTHQPSPWINDYGQFSLMVSTNGEGFDEEQRASWFSHKAEVAQPYYYQVYLADHDVLAELTPTDRAAVFRFTFPERVSSYVLVDAFDKGSQISIVDDYTLIGYSTKNSGGVPKNFKNYFVVRFEEPFISSSLYKDSKVFDKKTLTADHVLAALEFQTNRGKQITVRVASSFISVEQAFQNLKEVEEKSFDEIKENGARRWNEVLGRIVVNGKNKDQLKTFYSALYRSLLFPRKFYEYTSEGKMVHYSPYDGAVHDGPMYTDTGFWDTFRCLFPFLNLMYPDVNLEIQKGLVNTYKESGFFPEWASPGHRDCMVGNNSASVLVDAYLKGVQVDDVQTLYQGLLHGASQVHPTVRSTGRLGAEYYNRLGYVPYDVGINESAARTLEYAYDDWCILQLAKALKRPEKEIKELEKRAMNYKNLFDSTTRLMRGRNENGTFQKPFSPLKWGDAFTEGNSWHYTWSVFHDPEGLIKLMGGEELFVEMLDSVFNVPPLFDESYYGQVIHEIREMQIMNMGNYAHGNQPIQHMIYLYNYGGTPWKAQYWLREVMNRLYTPEPDGYCGDEDNGQTSAWYVFSALGFYPVCPGTNQYVIGSPLFDEAELNFEQGNSLKLIYHNNSDSNRYIQEVRYNGKVYAPNYLTHEQLRSGGLLEFFMGDKPNKLWGASKDLRPYSFSLEH